MAQNKNKFCLPVVETKTVCYCKNNPKNNHKMSAREMKGNFSCSSENFMLITKLVTLT